MSSANQAEIIDSVELLGDLGSEEPSSASGTHGPSLDVLRVGPHEIAEGSLVGDLLASLDSSDLVDCLNIRGETSMDTEHLTLDEGGNAEVVEHLSAVLPRVRVTVLSDDLVIESIDRSDLSRFVVSSEKSDVTRITDL